jgi:hypothetical protein
MSAATPIPNRKSVSGSGIVTGLTPTAAQRFDERRLKAIIDRYFMWISRKFALCALKIHKHITCLILFF